MTPKRLDVDVAHERLRQLHTTLDQLQAIADNRPDLDDDPIARAALERLVQVAVDLAVDVSAHVVVAATGAAPAGGFGAYLREMSAYLLRQG